MAKRALITGVNGQDGAYLAKLLLDKGYEVVGAMRHAATARIGRLVELGIHKEVEFVELELLEFSNQVRVLERVRVEELYNLAALSFVGVSFEQPIYTGEVDAIGPARLLEAIRTVDPTIRFYQASTSEMFGKVRESPQNEDTPFHPRSPYGVAKAYAHWMTLNFRETHGMHATSGILFNHESPLRGQDFVTRKISLGLARVKHGEEQRLELGNLDAQRDWGFAGDYVDGMWRMLQQERAEDFVLATGEPHSVREFVVTAGRHFGFDIEWQGRGAEERGVDRISGRAIVGVNPRHLRPAEVDILRGDAAKAREKLGWSPRVGFAELVGLMCEADERRLRDGRLLF